MDSVEPTTVLGVAIPSYRDGLLAIESCEAMLRAGTEVRSLRVAIVSNGPKEECFDSIEGLQSRFADRGWTLRHEHNEDRGKPQAWQQAEEMLGEDCVAVVYLDADIRLSPNALGLIAREAGDGSHPFVMSPRPVVVPPRSRWVRAYGDVWSSLPHVRKDVVGAGCFAVTAKGRRRWREWPPVFADDTFVRLLFKGGERRVLENVQFTISLPEKLSDLIKVRARWMQGYRDLLDRFPLLRKGESRRWGEMMRWFLVRPRLYPSLLVFAGVWFAARIYIGFSGDSSTRNWSRADSTPLRRQAKN